MRVALTGHLNITEETAVLVRAEIARRLAEVPELVGASCLAREADSLFAQVVLAVTGFSSPRSATDEFVAPGRSKLMTP